MALSSYGANAIHDKTEIAVYTSPEMPVMAISPQGMKNTEELTSATELGGKQAFYTVFFKTFVHLLWNIVTTESIWTCLKWNEHELPPIFPF